MNYHIGVNSHTTLWNSQPGLGGGCVHDVGIDRQSIYSVDSRSSGSPLGIAEASAVTEAQAYARAVKTSLCGQGETRDRALHYTVERKQPERIGMANGGHLAPSHKSDPQAGFSEPGPSFAQRLYASGLGHKFSGPPSGGIPVLPPIQYTSSSAIPAGGGRPASSEVSQAFTPTDLYHSSIATHAPRSATDSESSINCPRQSLPVSRVSNCPPVPRPYPAHRSSSCSDTATQLEVGDSHALSHQLQSISMGSETWPHRISVVRHHEASSSQELASIETRSPAVSEAMPPPPLGSQQPNTAPLYSPPAFEGHERLLDPSRRVEADVAPLDIQSLGVAPQEDGLPDSLLQSSAEVNHDEVPSYSLVDEQPPPPAFDDLEGASTAEASLVVMSPHSLPQENNRISTSSSHPPVASQHSVACDTEKAPAYDHLDKTTYPASTSKKMLQYFKLSPPPIITESPSDTPLFASSSKAAINFQSPSPSPLASPLASPMPSDLHVHSVPCSPNRQFIGTSRDPLSVHKSMTISPPPVNYNTKPIAEQGRERFFIPPALRSGSKPLGASNMVKKERLHPQPVVNVAAKNFAIEALTHSMSSIMMRASSLDTGTLAFQTLPSNRQVTPGTSYGNEQSNISPCQSSGMHRIVGPLSPEASGPEAGRLVQDAYWRPAHGYAGGRAGYGI